VLIKILYVVLVLCVAAILGAAVAGYFRIRRHMNGKAASPAVPAPAAPEVEQQIHQ